MFNMDFVPLHEIFQIYQKHKKMRLNVFFVTFDNYFV
jgi:hypothetical protein